MTNSVGNPSAVVQESAGWGLFERRADGLAGLNTELRFHLDSDSSINYAGLAIDDVSVTACQAVACTIVPPANVTTGNDAGQCGAVVNYPAPGGTCTGVVCVPASGSFFAVGTTTVTCSDPTGGTMASFDVTVNDAEAPTISALSLQTGTDAPACSAVVNYPAPGVSDNCPGAGAAVCAPPSGSTFSLGTTPVACSAQDAAGNVGNGGFNVTVVDDDAPTATAPDANVGTDDGLCTAVYSYTPGYADNCPGGSTVCTPASGSTFPLGANPVNCTATDGAGNQGFDAGTVTVFDDEAPTLICPADLFVGVPPGTISWPVTYGEPAPADNCPGATASCAPPSGDPFPLGTTTVVCSATDGAGLTAGCDFDVTVGAQTIQDIPTLAPAGLALLALALAGLAALTLRRRRRSG